MIVVGALVISWLIGGLGVADEDDKLDVEFVY
jgi:hypothetical protein